MIPWLHMLGLALSDPLASNVLTHKQKSPQFSYDSFSIIYIHLHSVFCINHHQWSRDLQTSIKFLEDLFSLNRVSIMILDIQFQISFVKFFNKLALAYPIGTASMPALSVRDSFILRQFRHSLWLNMPLLLRTPNVLQNGLSIFAHSPTPKKKKKP